jgi:hypothetical protein
MSHPDSSAMTHLFQDSDTFMMRLTTEPHLSRPFIFLLFCLFSFSAGAQTRVVTKVHGKVVDAKTGSGLAYATVQFLGDQQGTRTDIDGNFYMETGGKPKQIRASYVGYKTQQADIKPGTSNEITISMQDVSVDIKEITIRPKKYSKKNNPAVDLIEEVFKHKDQNRKEGLDFCKVDKYEKLECDFNGITERFKHRWYFKKFQFMWNYLDTNKVDQKIALPTFIRERLLTNYYRKDPARSSKDYLHAEQNTGLNPDFDIDQGGISTYLNTIYQDIDIYSPTIPMLATQFIGPLSGAANAFYRFYIVDTIVIDGKKHADIFFAPRNKTDLAFMGNMIVVLDSTYAVKKVEMGISKEINLNWVSALHLVQDFDFVGTGSARRLLITRHSMVMDFNILRSLKGLSVQARNTIVFKNYELNKPLPDILFKTPLDYVKDTGKIMNLGEKFWAAHRYEPMTNHEAGIEVMIDSVQKIRAFKTTVMLANLIGAGYKKFNKVEVGPVGTFLSFNSIEGTRLRLGGRTTTKFSKNVLLEGYGAYGTRDQKWKYNGAATFAFKGHMPRMFPMNQFIVGYQNDLRIPGLELDNFQQDNILLSAQRGVNDKMTYNHTLRLEYVREYYKGLSFTLSFNRRELIPAGKLVFQYQSPVDQGIVNKASLVTNDAGISLRFAPNERFYQGQNYRLTMLTKYPVFYLSFRAGLKGVLGGEYNYQRLFFKAQKTFFISPLGRSEITVEAARLFGTVPFPLLELAHANQSYEFDWYAYNLMNFLEFVSDHYAAVTWHHNFNGLFLNQIPLIKKLQWREVVCFKALYGGLDSRNRPDATNSLFQFPLNADGSPLTRTLDGRPYMEACVGVANIFKLIRLDYVRRLSYTNAPGISNWGIRFSLQAGF